jgi:hypothetical protein
MRRLWWVGLLSAVLMSTACEQDEGEGDGDVATDTGGDLTDTGGDTAGGPLCPNEPIFNDSCAAEFFTCFDPSCSYTVVSRPEVGGFAVQSIDWTSGAQWFVEREPVNGNRRDRAVGSNGAVCTSAESVQPLASGARTPVFQRAGVGNLQMEIDASGNMRITCPDNTTENFTAAQTATFMGCLGASCNGVIPFVQ